MKDSQLDDDCDPLPKAPDGRYYWPCGLAAQSFFNGIYIYIYYIDSIKLTQPNTLIMYESDITWKTDREKKFKNPKTIDKTKYVYLDEAYPGLISLEKSDDNTKSNYYGGGVQDEHFIVWMKTAALPNFRKLYGRITEDIEADSELEFQIDRKSVV